MSDNNVESVVLLVNSLREMGKSQWLGGMAIRMSLANRAADLIEEYEEQRKLVSSKIDMIGAAMAELLTDISKGTK